MSTTHSLPLLFRIVSVSISAAQRAQIIIRQILHGGDLNIVDKGGNDPQTEADRLAQITIVTALQKEFPNVAIKGEEDDACRTLSKNTSPDDLPSSDHLLFSHICPEHLKYISEDQVVIWVDPLDGTREFTEGLLDNVTVLIGIAVDGIATAGVIAQPFYNFKCPSQKLGRIIWGIKDVGTFGATISKPPVGENIITMTRSHGTSMVTEAVHACHPSKTIPAGGCGYKTLLVLEGKAHAYVFASKGCKKWDTCAPEAVLHAAGGRLTDLHGTLFNYRANVVKPNTGGVLATSANHEWYVKRIPPHILKALPSQA